jgi:hypothetical protein
MIWTRLLPWVALAAAGYGVFIRDVVWILWGIFLILGGIFWHTKPAWPVRIESIDFDAVSDDDERASADTGERA